MMEPTAKLLAKVSCADPIISVSDRGKQEEGIRLDALQVGEKLELATKNRIYVVENRGNDEMLISGHPKYCPQPTLVKLYGSTEGWTTLRPGFIGQGMYLEFRHPELGPVRTSRIEEIRLPKQPPQSAKQPLAPAV
jgi:hypothetical protein